MTDNFYSTADYPNWLNATNGYDIYDANYTFSYDESYFTNYQNISPTSNNNGTFDPNEFVLPWWRQILWSILFGGMVIVSTVGNLIVIWIVLAHKRMRTPTNYFLVNLSIADAMVSTLNVTFSFTYMLNSHWPFGTLYCKISQFVAILSIGASVFTLMAIAIDRISEKSYPCCFETTYLEYVTEVSDMRNFAESKKGSFNLKDTKAIKLEVTDSDGHVVVKDVKGEEMACVLKCFPIKEKRCRTKTTPEDDTILNTTPLPSESYETPQLTTGARMSTIPSSRSASNLTKKEQAVSAETSTKVPHNSKKEDKISTIMTTKRTVTKGSTARTTPNKKLLNATAIRPQNSYSDYPSLRSGYAFSDLDYSFEVNNQRTFRTKSPKKKNKHPNGGNKSYSKLIVCDSEETDEIKQENILDLSERRLKKKMTSKVERSTTYEPNRTTHGTTVKILPIAISTSPLPFTTQSFDQLTMDSPSESSTTHAETNRAPATHVSATHASTTHTDTEATHIDTEATHTDTEATHIDTEATHIDTEATNTPTTHAPTTTSETTHASTLHTETIHAETTYAETPTIHGPTTHVPTTHTSTTHAATTDAPTTHALNTDALTTLAETLHASRTHAQTTHPEYYRAKTTVQQKNYDLRRHSHEDYDIDCNSNEGYSGETISSTEQSNNPMEIEKQVLDVISEIVDNVASLSLLEKTTDIPAASDALYSDISETTTTDSSNDSMVPTSTVSEPLRRMSESEEMSTICDSIEDQLIDSPSLEPSKSKIQITNNDTTVSKSSSTTVTEAPRNSLLTSILPTVADILSLNLNVTATATLNTESMRRMSDSEEIVTDCESNEEKSVNEMTTSITQTTQSTISAVTSAAITIPSTYKDSTNFSPKPTESSESLTTSKLRKSTINELSRRMSESDEDCNYEDDNVKPTGEINSAITKLKTSTISEIPEDDSKTTLTTFSIETTTSAHSTATIHSQTTPLGELTETSFPDSMRRMSESEESSVSCEADEDLFVLTTMTPIPLESMRRMSVFDSITTERNYHIDSTTSYDELTEYVTECDTEEPLIEEITTELPQTNLQNGSNKINIDTSSLPCCPDAVCSLLYPGVPRCDERITDSPPIDVASNFTNAIDMLRNMFYLYKSQVLITKISDSSDEMKKRTDYKHNLISLWNETFSIHQMNMNHTNPNHRGNNEIMAEIYHFLNNSNSLPNDSFLNMILEVTKRIESDFPNKKVLKYPTLRQIILESIPKDLSDSTEIYSLTDYMERNEDYNKERLLFLQLLLDIQDRYGTEINKNSTTMEDQSDNRMKTKPSGSPESLQENGLGIKMHRRPKKDLN